MSFTAAGKNTMLDACGITHAALYDGEPGSGGAEIVGGGYARQAVTLAAASGGSKAASGTVTFSIPAGATVRWVGWLNGSGGGATLLAKDDIADEAYGASGTLTLTAQTFSI